MTSEDTATPSVHRVRVDHSGGFVDFDCPSDVSVLVAMTRHGRQAIQAGCHGGGCGICRVRILSGTVDRKRMSRAHVSENDEADGVALACRIYPRSDLVLAPRPLRA